MRRLILEEPIAWAATWSRRAAWFAATVAAISVWLVRAGRVDVETGLALIGASTLLALFTLGLAALAFSAVWTHGQRGVGRSVFGFALALALLAGPASALVQGLRLPSLADVTTDIVDPPAFSRSRAAAAARGGRVPADPGPAMRALQREAYPQIAPVYVDAEPAEAFEIVRRATLARGLEIIETVAPGGRTGIGRIEAVQHSLVLRLPTDVTIRIRARGEGSRIDIRSASRTGWHDLGANADLIRKLATQIAAEALNG